MSKNAFEKAVDEVQTPYGRITFFRNDQFIGRSLSEYGEWAKKEIDFLASLIEPGSVIVDAGAFIGTHTMAFSCFVGPEGKVYSFEPHPVYFKLLQRNIKNNELPNVQVFNSGLSDRPGEMEVNNVDIYKTSGFGSEKLTDKTKNANKLTVKITIIDDLRLESCELIKVDVEGMEKNVLAGGQTTIKQFKPFVYAECNSADAAWPIVQLMRVLDYKIYVYSEIAYNSDNYLKNQNNIFGNARELAIICVPTAKDAIFYKNLNNSLDIVPIDQLDDLVLAFLKKPQYKEEVLACASGVSKWGNDFWTNESELEQIKRQIEEIEKEREAYAAEKTVRENERNELQKQIDALNQAVSARDRQITDLNQAVSDRIAAVTERATKSEDYAESLSAQVDKLRESLQLSEKALDEERESAQREIAAVTERATT
jgi:FkbM family methyltransferase